MQTVTTLLVLAACVACTLAQDPPRPYVSENFLADLELQARDADGRPVFGRGRWAIDQAQNRAVQDFEFREGLAIFFQYDLFRADMGAAFRIDSYDRRECKERVINGSLPSFWGWVKQASYVGKDIYHHKDLDLWGLRVGDTELELGVMAPDYDRPVIFRRRSGDRELSMEFRFFANNASFEDNWFDVPSECKGDAAAAATQKKSETRTVAADPTHPQPSENFISEVDVEFHPAEDRVMFGRGRWAQDTAQNRAVQDFELHEQGTLRWFFQYDLYRFDQKAEYRVDSYDRRVCKERVVDTPPPPFWAWVKEATYAGKDIFRHRELDLWRLSAGDSEFELGVVAPEYDRPVVFRRRSRHDELNVEFRYFYNNASFDDRWFDVPSECQGQQ